MTADAFVHTLPLEVSEHDREVGSRSVLRQAVLDAMSQLGARLGLIWIGMMILGAVFAPFIASSFPMLLKIDGHWSSPLLRNLEASDVTLLVAFFTAFTLCLTRRTTVFAGVAIVVWMCALTLPLALLPAIRGGWRPGQDALGSGKSTVLLVLFGLIDLTLLVGLPNLVRPSRAVTQTVAACAIIVAGVLLIFPPSPPINIVYERYRELQASGQVQSVVRTVVPFSPNDYQRDNADARVKPPSLRHWMGTEGSGADVFSRMLHATRIALSIGFISTGISVLIGVFIGGLMGYFAGMLDLIGMRVIEVIESVPTLVLLLTVCAFFGRNLYLMMIVIGLLSWTGNARFIRAEFFRLRNQDFVQAGVAAGLPTMTIIFRHMLPNGLTPVLVSTSFGVASAILFESTLSFLGLGLVDEPSWGNLLEQARAGGTGFNWWLATFPGLAIFLTVLSYNLIGEAFRDALDPKLRKRD